MIKAGIQFARPEATLKQTVEQLPALPATATDPAGTPPLKQSEETTETWSGYFEWGGEGHFTKADLYYKDPANKHNSCETGGETETSIWAGLGGNYEKAPLAQTGTLMGNSTHKNGIAEQEAFIEVPNGEPVRPEHYKMPLTAVPGDWIQADVQYDGNDEFSFFVENLARHEATHAIGRGKVDANVADFIIERTAPSNLVNVGDVQMQGFTNNKAFATNRQKIQRETLVNLQEEPMAKPGQPLPNNFEFFDNYENRCLNESFGTGLQGNAENAPPMATTEPAESVGGSTATLKGVVNPEGQEARYSFEYGTEEYNYSESTPQVSAGSGPSPVNVSRAVTGLSPGTTYHYRIIADGAGGIVAGADHTFKTTGTPPPPPPTVTTEGASSLGAHTATLGATVNPNGADTHYYFEYGTVSGLYENDAPAPPGNDAGSGSTPVQVSAELTALAPNTTYYYRTVATNSTGTTYGVEKEVKTLPPWTMQTTQNPHGSSETDEFRGVSCWSSTGCDAVGMNTNGEDEIVGLVERWNGSAWEVQPTPKSTGAKEDNLESVACRSASECEATGYAEVAEGKHVTLAERWNGTAWSVQSIPTKGNDSNLVSVSCVSASECVASGFYLSSAGKQSALVELWNGKEWKILTTATLPKEDEQSWLESLSCPSSKHCTAVGAVVTTLNGIVTLAESYNGSTWTVQTTPTPEHSIEAQLSSVSCSATNACTAVGGYDNSAEKGERALIERYNGTSWQLQEAASPVGKPAPKESHWALTAVSCPTSGSCVTVGSYAESAAARKLLLGEEWNGTSWELALPVDRTGAGVLYDEARGVSCSAALTCTLAGLTWKEHNPTETLAERMEP